MLSQSLTNVVAPRLQRLDFDPSTWTPLLTLGPQGLVSHRV